MIAIIYFFDEYHIFGKRFYIPLQVVIEALNIAVKNKKLVEFFILSDLAKAGYKYKWN